MVIAKFEDVSSVRVSGLWQWDYGQVLRILDLLSQVRNQKNLELISDMNRMNQEAEKKDEKEGEE